jgi:hypothetical protein
MPDSECRKIVTKRKSTNGKGWKWLEEKAD